MSTQKSLVFKEAEQLDRHDLNELRENALKYYTYSSVTKTHDEGSPENFNARCWYDAVLRLILKQQFNQASQAANNSN